MSGECEDEIADEDVHCPFCNETGSCEHLLLYVDTTFRQAEGGLIHEAFNARWSDILGEQRDDVDERELFETLLDQVDSLSDATVTTSQDSVPGMSANYGCYFCCSKEKALASAKAFADAD